MNDKEKKYCPLTVTDNYLGICLKEKCQWWIGYTEMIINNKGIVTNDCAIALIPYILGKNNK